ncbi:hypothetical protein DFS33DRAFT_1442848 [Desarmillaria ectypa]|nr:hypothetical protein DFS33DRAFT_1442848 [Desarmillaria ectypa]
MVPPEYLGNGQFPIKSRHHRSNSGRFKIRPHASMHSSSYSAIVRSGGWGKAKAGPFPTYLGHFIPSFQLYIRPEDVKRFLLRVVNMTTRDRNKGTCESSRIEQLWKARTGVLTSHHKGRKDIKDMKDSLERGYCCRRHQRKWSLNILIMAKQKHKHPQCKYPEDTDHSVRASMQGYSDKLILHFVLVSIVGFNQALKGGMKIWYGCNPKY